MQGNQCNIRVTELHALGFSCPHHLEFGVKQQITDHAEVKNMYKQYYANASRSVRVFKSLLIFMRRRSTLNVSICTNFDANAHLVAHDKRHHKASFQVLGKSLWSETRQHLF